MRCLPILLLLLLCMTASARLPAVGDHVQILTQSGLADDRYIFEGRITEIDESMICLNCSNTYHVVRAGNSTFTMRDVGMSEISRVSTEFLGNKALINLTPPLEICIGKGSIIVMTANISTNDTQPNKVDIQPGIYQGVSKDDAKKLLKI